MGNFTNFSTALQPMLQAGFLEREFEEGLDSILAYRREALQETIPARIGETLTRTRTGRKPPITTPFNPSSNTGLDNGLSPSDAALEQYVFTMFEYADTSDLNLMDDTTAIANNLRRIGRNNGVQAAQSIERVCRSALFSAYLGGNTRVRVDLGASNTTSCHVDDVRGFTTVLVNGVVQGVSGTYTMLVQETAVGAGGVTQTLTVTGASVDATNNSSVPDGKSGVITFAAAAAPVNGDALVANNAAKILRPFSHITSAQMTGGDVLTMGLVQDCISYLRDNGVPPMDDGSYHCICDNTSMRQLWADQDFKVLFAGRYESSEYKDGDIIRLIGVTFIPTTETYVQPALQQYNGLLYGTAGSGSGVAAINVRIRRVIVCGAEHMIQGNFEGMDMWLSRQGVNTFAEVFLVNNVAHIIRPPLDRLQQSASMSWVWIGAFAVPTDMNATSLIIPTASNALYKRCVCIEHAG